MSEALLLIDVQNDFLPGGALPVPGAGSLPALANEILPLFEVCAATQDFHPPGHVVFASSHEGMSPGEIIEVDGSELILLPEHCVQGTAGAELASDLDRSAITEIFPKGTDPAVDSYSGFFDSGRKHETGLREWLEAQGIRTVFLVGVATEYCVLYTALDAMELGFATCVIEDACRGMGLNEGDEARAIAEMERAGAQRMRSEELLSGFAG